MIQFYKNSLQDAIITDNFAISKIVHETFVQMLPTETFFDVTDLSENIAFGGNLVAELVDKCDKVVLDITSLFYFVEFTDQKGIKQIAFEFGKIGIDFYTKQLHLKLIHTQSDSVWYSNGFTVTDYNSELTEYFEYKNATEDYFRTTRLKINKNDLDTKTDVKQYTQTNGNVISLQPTLTEIVKLSMELCDNFVYNRLRYLLNYDLVYLNGFRISDKPQIKKGERVGGSNIFVLDFEVNLTKNYKPFAYQLFEPLKLVTKTPIGIYGIDSFISNGISGTFNKNISIVNGSINIFKVGFGLIASYDFISNIGSNGFLTDDLPTLTIGKYYIQFPAGLFISGTETIEITNKTDWAFEIKDGEYNSNDYDSNDYLT